MLGGFERSGILNAAFIRTKQKKKNRRSSDLHFFCASPKAQSGMKEMDALHKILEGIQELEKLSRDEMTMVIRELEDLIAIAEQGKQFSRSHLLDELRSFSLEKKWEKK